MATDVIGPLQALREGCVLLRRHPVVLLGFAIFVCLLVICVIIPLPYYLNWALLSVVIFPLLGGLHMLLVNAARSTCPRLTDLFSGFRHLLKWLTAGYAFVGVFNACFVPCLLSLVGLGWLLVLCTGQPPHQYRALVMILSPVVAPVLAFGLFLEYAFILFAATDASSAGRSIARSQELAKGRRLKLFLTLLPGLLLPGSLITVGCVVYLADANAFGWPGWVLYTLGLATAVVAVLCAGTATYVNLDRFAPVCSDG